MSSGISITFLFVWLVAATIATLENNIIDITYFLNIQGISWLNVIPSPAFFKKSFCYFNFYKHYLRYMRNLSRPPELKIWNYAVWCSVTLFCIKIWASTRLLSPESINFYTSWVTPNILSFNDYSYLVHIFVMSFMNMY